MVNKILGKGGKAVAIHTDISKSADVRRLFSEAEKAMARLDIVVANAGVHILKPFVENTEADYDYIFNTNTKGVFFTLQEAARHMRDGGRIVVVSTGGTKMHFPNNALSRKQRGYRAICPLPGGRTRSAQRYGEHSVAGIHRYGHDAGAVPRFRRKFVSLQSRGHARRRRRRGCVSRK